MIRTTALALACLTAGCHMHLHGSSLVVDGVELEQEHVETIEIAEWHPSGIHVDSAMGDVLVQRGTGGNRITVTLHETVVGDARADYEDGKLVTRTASGEPSAIGDVTIYCDGELPALVVETGMGDIEVADVSVLGRVELSTGMGDVELERFGDPEAVVVTTGMGDLELKDGTTLTLHATSGMGDVELARVSAADADLSSGMGDVEVRDCAFERIGANTGLGDVECRSTTYREADLETGLGSVEH